MGSFNWTARSVDELKSIATFPASSPSFSPPEKRMRKVPLVMLCSDNDALRMLSVLNGASSVWSSINKLATMPSPGPTSVLVSVDTVLSSDVSGALMSFVESFVGLFVELFVELFEQPANSISDKNVVSSIVFGDRLFLERCTTCCAGSGLMRAAVSVEFSMFFIGLMSLGCNF